VVQVAVIALSAQLLPSLARLLPTGIAEMPASFALAVLFSVSSLFLLDGDGPRLWRGLGRIFALLAGAVSVVSLVLPEAETVGPPVFLSPAQAFLVHHSSLLPGIALLLIGGVLFFGHAASGTAGRVADLVTICLCLLTLTLTAEFTYAYLRIPGSSMVGLPSPATQICLVLLTAAIVLRRSESGVLSIFLGPGIGGKLARFLAPVLILFPVGREAARARILNAHLIPPQYAMAILGSVGTAVAFILLFWLVSRLNKLEAEIKDLTLRDELTGLYNVRGFNLLAGQSLRLAQRAELPFSVLFIDVDNLKRINDELGHNIGSASLSETAKLLDATFRDADVIARIGGDEFVVAGQFSYEKTAAAAQRLEDAAAARSRELSHPCPLSLSIGYATSSRLPFDTLKELLARADQAMYERKRRKKVALPQVAIAG
jgi:diguanylate cyclase (GGDEF)-like protein